MSRPRPAQRARLDRNTFLDRAHVESARRKWTEARPGSADGRRRAMRRAWLGMALTVTVLFVLSIGYYWSIGIAVDPRQTPGRAKIARTILTLVASGTVGYLMGRASRARKARRPSTQS